MKKGNNENTGKTSTCPIKHLIDILGGKWKLPIICILSSEVPQRYSAVKRKLGHITDVMLSQSLHELEAAGILHREQYNEIPPRVEYTLTVKGRNFLPLLTQLAQWAVEDMKESACEVSCGQCVKMS